MNNLKKSKEGSISFPIMQCWDPSSEVATIAAQVSGERVLCRIPMAAIKKKFQAVEGEPMKVIIEYRKEIEAAARRLIEEKSFEKDGSIKIQFKDL